MAKNIFTSIEITDTGIRLFQARTVRHKRVLCACDVKPLQNFTDAEITGKLSELTALRDIQPQHSAVVIPRRLTILKQIRLPSQNDSEIRKMLDLQLVNQIPYALEDVIYDFVVVDREPSGYVRVLVAIVHRQDVSEKFLKLCKEAGLQPERFVLSSLGIIHWLNYQQGKIPVPVSSNQTVLVLNIDIDHTEICFCHDQNLLFSRSVNYGARDLATENMRGLTHQVELSLKNYHKDNMGPAVKRMIVLSTLPEAAALKGRLEEISLVPVDFYSPLKNVLCQKNMGLGALKSQPGVSIAAGIGFLLSDGKKALNLIPQEVHNIKRSKRRQLQWVQLALLLVLTFGLALAFPGIEFLRKAAYLNSLKKKSEAARPELERIKKRMDLVKLVQQELDKRVVVTDLIQELYRLAPPEISFQSLYLNERGQFIIHGYAGTSASVHNFQQNLVKSALFKAVNLEFATKRKIFNMEVTDFQITSEVNVKHD